MPRGPLLVGCVLVAGGCLQILGDDFTTGDIDDGGGGAAGATSTGATSTGGGGPCVVGAIGACGAGMKCSVVDYPTGATGCIAAGPRPPFSRCAADDNCAEGTFCDPPSQVCLPICSRNEDCTNGGSCVNVGDGMGQQVVGISVCLANCNPITGQPCDQSYGHVTCHPALEDVGGVLHADEFFCWQSGGKGLGELCTEPTECAVGSMCATVCRRFCSPIASSCDSLECHQPPGIELFSDGVEYGFCGCEGNPFITEPPSCLTCLEEQCCAEAAACGSDPSCIDCVFDPTQGSCPNHVEANAFLNCFQTACASCG